MLLLGFSQYGGNVRVRHSQAGSLICQSVALPVDCQIIINNILVNLDVKKKKQNIDFILIVHKQIVFL